MKRSTWPLFVLGNPSQLCFHPSHSHLVTTEIPSSKSCTTLPDTAFRVAKGGGLSDGTVSVHLGRISSALFPCNSIFPYPCTNGVWCGWGSVREQLMWGPSPGWPCRDTTRPRGQGNRMPSKHWNGVNHLDFRFQCAAQISHSTFVQNRSYIWQEEEVRKPIYTKRPHYDLFSVVRDLLQREGWRMFSKGVPVCAGLGVGSGSNRITNPNGSSRRRLLPTLSEHSVARPQFRSPPRWPLRAFLCCFIFVGSPLAR